MPAPLRILFLASEVVPHAKTGGLADVAGALPAYLRRSGHDVLTVMPGYDTVDRTGFVERPGMTGVVTVGGATHTWTAEEDPGTGVTLIDIGGLFDRGALYTADPDEVLRFAAFGAAALDLVRVAGWAPDVIHCNDWQTGLVPLLARRSAEPTLVGSVSLITIHNLGYQGRFDPADLPELFDPDDGEAPASFLEAGLRHSDAITTVSPTYADEIRTPEGGAGLHQLLRSRSDDVVGILNGIDTDTWNPRTDRLIPARYSAKSLWRKERNKEALLTRIGLPYRPEVPVVGMITRLAHQKGIDLLPGPLRHFLDSWDLRMVILGAGEPHYVSMLRDLASEYPGKLALIEGYDESLSHLIEAGSDIFLMPSLYEPCGLNQMYSLAYGTIPVVRRVGGLADTVEQADPATGTGTGVVFDDFDQPGLGWALGRALIIHLDRRGRRMIQLNGMAIDNSWADRAEQYEQLYRRLLEQRRSGAPAAGSLEEP